MLSKLAVPDIDHVFSKVSNYWHQLHRKHILLTGGTGFIGKWLMEVILEADRRLDLRCHISVLTRNPSKFIASTPHLAKETRVTLVTGDIRNFSAPNSAHYDVVIHAAADVIAQGNFLDVFNTCIEGTRRVLEVAQERGTERFLLISSGAVYGPQPSDVISIPETFSGGPNTLDIRSGYAEGKRAAEWLTNSYGQEGLNVNIARCFAFLGPYMALEKQFAIGNFIDAALRNRAIVIRGDGTPLRTYLYAADLAAWLLIILLASKPGDVFNVGGDVAISIEELALRVLEVTGTNSGLKVLRPRSQDARVERYVPDVSKARKLLGLLPWIAIDDAIDRTVRWHRFGSKG